MPAAAVGGGGREAYRAATSPLPAASAVPIPPPPFLSKTYDMVNDPATDAVVSWGPDGTTFVVWNTPEFSRDLLPKHFKHNNFSSFVRQLNTYGFKKVDPNRWEFANDGFVRGQKHLIRSIVRRKPSNVNSQQPHPPTPNSSISVPIEVGNFGLEEEVERLKRDKDLLMSELVRLRQQQQNTDIQMNTLGQRMQGMEQRQQRMMSFLAKAMQSPGFFAQFVQQNNSNRRITSGSKKRRLPKQENNFDDDVTSPDGQIIKFQPLINDAAKAMLMQILNMDTSSVMEPRSNSGNLLIDNGPPSLEGSGMRSSHHNSGVMIKEFLQSSSTPIVPDFSGIPLSPVPVEINTPNIVCMDSPETDMFSSPLETFSKPSQIQGRATDAGMLPSTLKILPEFSQMHDMAPDNTVQIKNRVIPEAENINRNPVFAGVDGLAPDITGDYSEDDFFLDGDKLPDVNDPFWEQLIMLSPGPHDDEEVDSSTQDASTDMQAELNDGWSDDQIADLTEQMELLESEFAV